MKTKLLVVSLLLLFLILWILGCSCGSSRGFRSSELCVTNLTMIWWGLQANIGDGIYYPTTFAQLAELHVSPDAFVCPGTNHKLGPMANVEEWSDLIYFGGLKDGDSLNLPILASPPENHGGLFGFVVWIGGNVDRVSSEQIRMLIKYPWCMDTNAPTSVTEDLQKRVCVSVPRRLKDIYPYAYHPQRSDGGTSN